MKSKKLFAIVVFVVLAALGCAMSAAAEDAVFTCDSDPADFNGKTFENLYLDVEGCGEDIVFTDLSVTGNLVYNGGRDASDHHITFDKPSIRSMWIACEATHNASFTFIPSPDVEYVVSEMTVMPAGSEKGKIILNGTGDMTLETVDEFGKVLTQDFFATEIDRLNYVSGQITDDVKASFRDSQHVPDEFVSLDTENKNIELEINHLSVMEMSVVNMNKTTVPSVTSNDWYRIYLLAVYSPSIKLFSCNAEAYGGSVYAMISASDGENVTVSLDHICVPLFHFFGNNQADSVLSILVGNEILHDRERLIRSLFLFGSNLDFMGYGNPKRRVIDMDRVIITEQPDDYGLHAVPTMLNDYLKMYGSSADAGEEDWKLYNKHKYPFTDYGIWLGAGFYFTPKSLHMLVDLSQQYGINYPDSGKNWSPEINLSYVNIGKAICAKEIADRIGPYQMIHINHPSYMNAQPDVMRYVMPEGVTQTLGETPKVTPQTQLDDLFEGLPDGCYVFSFDQYGRPYLKE